jgi:hypothetical protein
MRPKFMLRPRPVHVAAGVVMLAIPASALALTAQAADAPSVIHPAVDRQQLRYGQRVVVTGTAPAADRGQRLSLEFAPAGGTWEPLASTTIAATGRFRFVASMRESGSVRVTGGATAAAATASAGASAAIAPSAPQPVAVAAALAPQTGSIDVLTGQSFDIRGRLVPGQKRRVVTLQAGGTGHGWKTLTTARTSRAGRFDLRSTAGGTGQEQLRVKFAGDRLNSPTSAPSGRLTVYRSSVASWYSDGGGTACGFHAGNGVANKTLPCGTKVTFSYHGRTVTAVVDDRGPYVGGRDWDLNQNVAGALGFNGVDTLWSSI